ncbi:MAG TPA: antibiotic biosynthesis monooxygenase family protein [Devosia sp.]|nr:antibiotic biosynthesis monooxygenase family protein [Devosia sp.]
MRYVIGRMSVRSGTRTEFLAKAAGYISASRADKGCVYFEIAPVPDRADDLIMIEGWETEGDHKAHQASDYAKAFGSIGGAYLLRGDFQEMNVDKAEQVSFDLSKHG